MSITNSIKNFYSRLRQKYTIRPDSNIVDSLSISMILSNYATQNIHFNFPQNYDLQYVINQLYVTLSKKIFKEYPDMVNYEIGDRFQKRNEKPKKIWVIKEKIGYYKYTLVTENDPTKINQNLTTKPGITYDKLQREYTLIRKSTRNTTLQKFYNFFKEETTDNFTPQHFSKKIVFIAGQTIWNNLKKKDCIPTTYLPNTREGEQTKRKSIEAFEDDIAFVTPKYEVCYDELLNNSVEIDTMIVCDTDLDSIPQIIQDKQTYKFKLVVLSTKSDIQRQNGFMLWNWQQEEINIIEHKSKEITYAQVQDEELNKLMQHFEQCMQYVSSLDIPIKLKSYGYFLRLALNALQKEQYEYLLMRLERDNNLERNDGGYSDFGENNPKKALQNLIFYLKENTPKLKKFKEVLSTITLPTLSVVDRVNIDNFKSTKRCHFYTQKEFQRLVKKNDACNKTIVFCSFNGQKDFEFIYQLSNNVKLVLYKEEVDLFQKQFQKHTKQLEQEISSSDRRVICGVKYEITNEPEVKVSPTLEQIIANLEQRSNIAYEGYKDESDCLLDDLEEDITYRISTSDGKDYIMQSNETVFDSSGNLLKTYKLKIGSVVRVYPKYQLAENLFQIAVEVEPERFGLIEKNALVWFNCLKEIDERFATREELYKNLKENGLKVLPATVDAYFRGQRKFPMFNTDLRAILKVANKENLYDEIKISKRLYNATMIALGRGVKQEIKQFLQDKTIGEILQKKGFTKETLQEFINKYMSLMTITKIEEVNDEQ